MRLALCFSATDFHSLQPFFFLKKMSIPTEQPHFILIFFFRKTPIKKEFHLGKNIFR